MYSIGGRCRAACVFAGRIDGRRVDAARAHQGGLPVPREMKILHFVGFPALEIPHFVGNAALEIAHFVGIDPLKTVHFIGVMQDRASEAMVREW